jgi:hypothetical protein
MFWTGFFLPLILLYISSLKTFHCLQVHYVYVPAILNFILFCTHAANAVFQVYHAMCKFYFWYKESFCTGICTQYTE